MDVCPYQWLAVGEINIQHPLPFSFSMLGYNFMKFIHKKNAHNTKK
jgi:hypothetical protein